MRRGCKPDRVLVDDMVGVAVGDAVVLAFVHGVVHGVVHAIAAYQAIPVAAVAVAHIHPNVAADSKAAAG